MTWKECDTDLDRRLEDLHRQLQRGNLGELSGWSAEETRATVQQNFLRLAGDDERAKRIGAEDHQQQHRIWVAPA